MFTFLVLLQRPIYSLGMSMNLNITNYSDDELDDKQEDNNGLCAICWKHYAKYTCPKCNTPYCSLTCYKSEVHAECSELFYKESFLQEIKQNQLSDLEKRRMLEMLQRLQSEDLESQLAESEGADSDDDICNRFEGLNIESASFEELWSRLSDSEQEEFRNTVSYRNSNTNALDLLKMIDIWQPWWETVNDANKFITEMEQDVAEQSSHNSSFQRRPSIMQNIRPLSELTKLPPNPNLVFNLVNILFSYIFLCRSFNGEIFESILESCKLIEQISSSTLFSKSQFVYKNVENALMDSIAKSSEDIFSIKSLEYIVLLLRDLLAVVCESPSSAKINVMASLTQLYDILGHATAELSTKRKFWAAQKKLFFYIAFVDEIRDERKLSVFAVLRYDIGIVVERINKEMKEKKKEEKEVAQFQRADANDMKHLIKEIN